LFAAGEGEAGVDAVCAGVDGLLDRVHRTRIMQKLNLHNTAELVLYAVRKKIISGL
jgi:DNA-binding CsgD family transcriptional regulator